MQDITFIVASVASSDVVEVKDGLLLRPKGDPESWPLKATDLNPDVPEFAPTAGDEEEDIAGTDGDDESEEDVKQEVAEQEMKMPGLKIAREEVDGREKLAKLLDSPPKHNEDSQPIIPTDWVVVRKKSKDDRASKETSPSLDLSKCNIHYCSGVSRLFQKYAWLR